MKQSGWKALKELQKMAEPIEILDSDPSDVDSPKEIPVRDCTGEPQPVFRVRRIEELTGSGSGALPQDSVVLLDSDSEDEIDQPLLEYDEKLKLKREIPIRKLVGDVQRKAGSCSEPETCLNAPCISAPKETPDSEDHRLDRSINQSAVPFRIRPTAELVGPSSSSGVPTDAAVGQSPKPVQNKSSLETSSSRNQRGAKDPSVPNLPHKLHPPQGSTHETNPVHQHPSYFYSETPNPPWRSANPRNCPWPTPNFPPPRFSHLNWDQQPGHYQPFPRQSFPVDVPSAAQSRVGLFHTVPAKKKPSRTQKEIEIITELNKVAAEFSKLKGMKKTISLQLQQQQQQLSKKKKQIEPEVASIVFSGNPQLDLETVKQRRVELAQLHSKLQKRLKQERKCRYVKKSKQKPPVRNLNPAREFVDIHPLMEVIDDTLASASGSHGRDPIDEHRVLDRSSKDEDPRKSESTRPGPQLSSFPWSELYSQKKSQFVRPEVVIRCEEPEFPGEVSSLQVKNGVAPRGATSLRDEPRPALVTSWSPRSPRGPTPLLDETDSWIDVTSRFPDRTPRGPTPLLDESGSAPSASLQGPVSSKNVSPKSEMMKSAPPKLPWTALSGTSWDALYR